MAEVRWHPDAVNQLRAISDHISIDDAVAADRLITRLIDSIERLARFPQSGRVVPEFRDAAVREVIEGNYRIVYRAGSESVTIARVHHARRRMPKDLPK